LTEEDQFAVAIDWGARVEACGCTMAKYDIASGLLCWEPCGLVAVDLEDSANEVHRIATLLSVNLLLIVTSCPSQAGPTNNSGQNAVIK
jgi:hypothetical protein